MRRLKWGLVFGVLVAALAVGSALAAALPPQVNPAGVPTGFLVSGSLITERGPVEAFARALNSRGGIRVFTGHFQHSPSSTTGWHTHPGPVIHSIVSGTMTFYDGDDKTCTPRTYGPGQSFLDSGYGHVHLTRNESTTVPIDFYVTFLNPTDDALTAPAPAPGNCPATIR